MQTADVVLIGGGIVAASIAYHLTANGCRNVLVIERESALGKGSTGKSMGGVRAQFSTPVNIRMSLYSIPFYAKFDELLGYPCDYRPQGYLFCATTDRQMAHLRTNCELQVKMGLKTVRLMEGSEIAGMFPQLRADDILGGSFCATDGFVDPHQPHPGFRRNCDGRDHPRHRRHSQSSQLRGRLGSGRCAARRRGFTGRAPAPHASS
jgi:sarcosine oxidase subunit beta